jgi:malate dehydrogenase (oxaloacetate-decarboxylating)
MEPYRLNKTPDGQPYVEVPYRGQRLLRHPMFNKGTAFTREERAALGLEGLLPDAVCTLEQQEERIYRNVVRSPDPLQRYISLAALQDRNETLFYRLLVDHLKELMPVVYTPVVGQVCQEYSHIFRRSRGLWITPGHHGRIEEILANAPFDDIRLIVVTDNERILGLGDQGAGGMGIPIGKLALYVAAAGIHPTQCLPISLDVGTDNQELLADDLYLGWRKPRMRGEEYYSLVDEFVRAVKYRFPKALLQWEDFKKHNAFTLLDRYRKVITSFNDDIQGTAAVGVGGIMAGCRATGTPLVAQRVVIFGAGAAGTGITRLLRGALQRAGLQGEALTTAVAGVDVAGMLVDDEPIGDAYQREFAWPAELAARYGLGKGRPRDLEAVVRALKPTVLIGTSGQPGVFTESIVRSMAAGVRRPMIFPMSNPTSKSEAMPADIVRWTEGRALIATGSPFDPIDYDGRRICIGQANNVFVFPGMGLGVLLSEAKEVTDSLFAAAAERLANEIRAQDLAEGRLFPCQSNMRQVAAAVAEAVMRRARDDGNGRDISDARIPEVIKAAMWDPKHLREVPV